MKSSTFHNLLVNKSKLYILYIHDMHIFKQEKPCIQDSICSVSHSEKLHNYEHYLLNTINTCTGMENVEVEKIAINNSTRSVTSVSELLKINTA